MRNFLSRFFNFLALTILFWQGHLYAHPPIPKFLYHWTTYESLVQIAENKTFQSPWNSFPTKRECKFQSRYRSASENHLYTWSNPVAGMLAQENESYGDVLVELEIRVRAPRVLTIDTSETKHRNFDFSKVDLVFFRNGSYQEWIILNPSIVINFTADPDVLRPMLTDWLQRLRDPTFKFSADETHAKNVNRISWAHHYMASVVSDFLSNRDLIPPYFLRGKKGEPTFERWVSAPKLTAAIRTWRNNPLFKESYFRNSEYHSIIRRFDRLYSTYEVELKFEDLLREIAYRLNVITEFKMEKEISKMFARIREFYSFGDLNVQLPMEIRSLRQQWAQDTLSTSILLSRAFGAFFKEDSFEFQKLVKLLEKVELNSNQKFRRVVFPSKQNALNCSALFN